MQFELLGYKVFKDGKLKLKEKLFHHLSSHTVTCETINCLNPHSYVVGKTDSLFRSALLESDILLPDGVGITLGARLHGKKMARITGFDVFDILMGFCNNMRLRILFVGSTEATLAKIVQKCEEEYPNLERVDVYSPPFKAEFNDLDKSKMLKFIESVNPDIIFVGMSAPKQEKWASDFKNKTNAKYIVSIGAVFDFFVGNVKRSPKLFRQLGLEWFPRLLQQPRRLARRTLISAPIFVFDILSDRLGNKICR